MEWKAIPDFFGYEASIYGKIRSLNYKRMGKVKELKPALDKKGYLRTALVIDGKSKTIKVHRIIALTFIPNPENKPQVNHGDGVKTNNRVDNLFWATNAENVQHAYDTGLLVSKSGDAFHRTKHSDELILKMKKEYDAGASKRSLAKKYNVDRNVFKRKIINEHRPN